MPVNQPTPLQHAFRRDGYVILRNFLPVAMREEIAAALERYIVETLPRLDSRHQFYEDVERPETLKQMCQIMEHEPYFAELMSRDTFRGLAEELLDDEVFLHECEWFDKPPAQNSPTPPHQDGFYFPIEPNEALTMWLAIDPADQDNGCLRYMTGSHHRGLRPHSRTQTLGFSQGISDFNQVDQQTEQCIELEPGDLAVHHSLTVHRATRNESGRHRRGLGLIYFAQRAKFDKMAQESYHTELFEELRRAGKI